MGADKGRKQMTRNRHQNTQLARRLRRLGWTLRDAERWTGEKYGNLKNYHQGRVSPCPRPILRLLAVYRLLNWGRF